MVVHGPERESSRMLHSLFSGEFACDEEVLREGSVVAGWGEVRCTINHDRGSGVRQLRFGRGELTQILGRMEGLISLSAVGKYAWIY